jgi:hypothetical protein
MTEKFVFSSMELIADRLHSRARPSSYRLDEQSSGTGTLSAPTTRKEIVNIKIKNEKVEYFRRFRRRLLGCSSVVGRNI